MAQKDKSAGIAPLNEVPAAFAPLGSKINELVHAVNGIDDPPEVGAGLKMIHVRMRPKHKGAKPKHKRLLTIDHARLAQALDPSNQPGGGGGGASGSRYTFTACVNGTAKSFDIDIRRGPY